MTNPEKKQEQKALELLKNLLKDNDAKGIREDLNRIFYGYITSEHSDYKNDRSVSYSTYVSLLQFFTKIDSLDKVNRWTNQA